MTASASINHVTLNENDIGPYRTFLKVSPPLRAEDDRKALVAALGAGLIDVLMSDHNPQDVETKRLPFAEAAPAPSASRLCSPPACGWCTAEKSSWPHCCARCRRGQRSCSGFPGGTLKSGAPADVIVVDMDVPWVVDPIELKSNARIPRSMKRA